jgi:hypothetical protein
MLYAGCIAAVFRRDDAADTRPFALTARSCS